MKKIKILKNRKNKKYIKILNDEKTFYRKKTNPKKIIMNLLFLIIYTIIVVNIVTFFNNRKYKPNKINNKNYSHNSNLINNVEYSKLDTNIDANLKFMTNNDYDLYQKVKNCLEKNPDELMCIYHLLCPKEVVGKTKVLLGPPHNDGSYVLLNDFENIKIAYSIGIDGNVDFDKALADRGIDVYMYDHTNNKLPYENEKFHWKKIGIGGNSERSSNIQTLDDMLKENGHLNEKNMILKIDTEGAEWNALNDMTEDILKKFKYIIIEYHFYNLEASFIYNILKKINKTHQVFYIHTNHLSRIINFGNNRIVGCIEVSYVIREGNNFTIDKSVYPIKKFYYFENKHFNPNIFKLFDNY